jgi:hypothetical protein
MIMMMEMIEENKTETSSTTLEVPNKARRVETQKVGGEKCQK